MSAARHLLVANPTAQSGKNAERIEKARVALDAAGVPHAFLATQPAGGTVAAVAAALRADRSITTAIYMGGDGTFAEVAKGIFAAERAADVRLAMLPTGTANDQGKSFGLHADEEALEENVRVIAAGHEARLDVGRLRTLHDDARVERDELFFDSAGWGISPRVLALRNEDRRAIEKIPIVREVFRDQLVYAGALLRTFLTSYVEDDKFDVTAICDGRRVELRGLSDLVIKGTKIYGGLWVLAPDSRPDDGKFELVPFTGKRDWVSKAIVALDHSGTVGEGLAMIGVTHSEMISATTIELELDERPGGLPLVAQIDGEELAATPRARVDVLPGALKIIVPA
jgi:diacylglycerol kinase family enzyme